MANDGNPTRVHAGRALAGTIISVVLWLWLLTTAQDGRGFWIPLVISVSLSFSLFLPAVWLYGGWVKRIFRSRRERAADAERYRAHARWWDEFSRAMESRGGLRPKRPGDARHAP
jgi:hypothetical protein